MIHIGPAGFGGDPLEKIYYIKKLELNAVEVEFTYGINMSKEKATELGKKAEKLGIMLSVHAPYYINLCSLDKKKINASISRILKSCELGNLMKAKYVVFHPAFYGKYTPEECYSIVKREIREMMFFIKKKKWKIELAPETTGKKSQFGSVDEILRLVREIKCSMCIDFAHIKARNGKIDYNYLFNKLKKFKHIHSHFSGIEYGKKGEKRHVLTPETEIKKLLNFIKKYKVDITIINESPSPIDDSIKTKEIMEKFKIF